QIMILQSKGVKSVCSAAFISGLTAGIGYLWVVWNVGNGTLTSGDIALFLTSIFLLSDYLRETVTDGVLAVDVWRMGNDFTTFINNKEAKAEEVSTNKSTNESDAAANKFTIEFDNVSFAYPFNNEDYVLKNINI